MSTDLSYLAVKDATGTTQSKATTPLLDDDGNPVLVNGQPLLIDLTQDAVAGAALGTPADAAGTHTVVGLLKTISGGTSIVPGSSVSLAAGTAAIGVVTAVGSVSSNGDGTITTGGTAQSLFAGVAPVNGWKISNPHPTEDLWVADNGVTAAPNVGYRIFAGGGQYATEPGEKPIGILSIYGATTGHAYGARKW